MEQRIFTLTEPFSDGLDRIKKNRWVIKQINTTLGNRMHLTLLCERENEIYVNGVVQEDYQVKLDNNKYIDLDPSMSNNPSIDVKPGYKIKIYITKE